VLLIQNDIDVLKASVCAYDAALLNKDIIQKNISFLSFSMTWLVRLVDPRHAHPAQMISLPLPDDAPMNFRMLPEYLLENISDYLEFVVKHAPPETLDKSDKDTIITFILVFLSPNYVNNPFLKAKFMSMLSIGVQPWGYFRKGIFYDNLVEHPLAVQHLMPTLVRFFVGESLVYIRSCS
jgi:ubiquitin conjugation factor E4 B